MPPKKEWFRVWCQAIPFHPAPGCSHCAIFTSILQVGGYSGAILGIGIMRLAATITILSVVIILL